MTRFVGLGEDPGVLAIRAPALFGVSQFIDLHPFDIGVHIYSLDDCRRVSRCCERSASNLIGIGISYIIHGMMMDR